MGAVSWIASQPPTPVRRSRASAGQGTDSAASVLIDAKLWESAFTTAYDAFPTAADAVVLFPGYRVPATRGGHGIATDIAHAVMQPDTDAFAPAGAERFRQGRHESEYFDPARPSTRPSLTRDGQ